MGTKVQLSFSWSIPILIGFSRCAEEWKSDSGLE
jgi:hypothetical protein